ncbi:MAG: glycerophosphodiester phosphodiesterase [Planctomycetes bacterium]|nr:glycerophosphodiester phosphodiesterase [Planctomycetota bacterium]
MTLRTPWLLAHRGDRAAGPENSRRSVVSAFRRGDGAEVDVLVTADGVPVLRHDERLPDGTPVRVLPLADLRRAVGADDDDLPTVASVLDALEGVGAPQATLNLELKVPGAARALVPLRERLARVTFTSFWAAEVLDAAARLPQTPRGLLLSHVPDRGVPPGVGLLAVLHRVVAPVRAAHPDARIWCWTVDDEAAAARAHAAGAQAWIGDDLDGLARWRDALSRGASSSR